MESGINSNPGESSRSKSDFRCRICGANLYPTDQGANVIIFHCSSSKARFWNYFRGTNDLIQAKRHWDNSKMELALVSK